MRTRIACQRGGGEDANNDMFHVLDERQLKHVFKIADEHLKMPVWKYNDKCYLILDDKKCIHMLSMIIMI